MAGEASRGRERTAREREVRRLLSAGERDGLTLRETAARAGMPTGTLAWWTSEIRRRDAVRARDAAKPVFLEVVVPEAREAEQDTHARAGSAEVAPDAVDTAGDAPSAFEVELRGGRRLRVASSYGLARLVREIEGC
jgi:hypothetical protein